MLLRNSFRKLKGGPSKHMSVPAKPKGSVLNARVHQIRTHPPPLPGFGFWLCLLTPVRPFLLPLTHQISASLSEGWESTWVAVWSCFVAITILVHGDTFWSAKSYCPNLFDLNTAPTPHTQHTHVLVLT